MNKKMTVAASMALNFLSSVMIIWANKMVFVSGFECPLTLTILHFISSFFGLAICVQVGVFQAKIIPFQSLISISIAFSGFVILNNLSLRFNSISTYQLLKVLTTPAIVFIQYFIYSTRIAFFKILSLIPICLGVILATFSPSREASPSSSSGIWFGILGVIVTSVYQIWVKTEQTRLDVTPQQLLLLQAPLSALILLPFAVFSETSCISRIHVSTWTLFLILGSSILAFLVNISIFLVIRSSSPLAYNVLGHLKLCVILTSGYTLFGESFTVQSLIGVFIAFIGIVWYTHISLVKR